MGRTSLKNVCRLIDIANEELPIERQFLNDLEVSIEKSARLNSRLPSQTYKPSGMLCTRQMVYQVLGYVPSTNSTASLVGICESGTDRHLRIQKAIEEMKQNEIDCEYIDVAEYITSRQIPDIEIVEKKEMETKLYNPKLNLSFLCDGIIRYKKKYYILEIKTESSNKFLKREGVDESHYNQAIAYSTNLLLDDVMFLYENRDICLKKCYVFHVTPQMKEDFIAKIEYCDSYVKQLKAPPKPQNILKKACTYCGYRKYCEKDLY